VNDRSKSDQHRHDQHDADTGEQRDEFDRCDSPRMLLALSPAVRASVVQHLRRP
jgi:hypothetical protein